MESTGIEDHVDRSHIDIRRANPDVDLWLPGEGAQILIPARYILPDAPRDGIVISLGELRLYHFREVNGKSR